uniref:Fibronectin type-III domain-containing protein n=1 Tax=Ficedula albicollis TaxID=59894 RepID=A0A803VYT6_FICAL
MDMSPSLSFQGLEETCQKPHWDSRLQLAPNQESYKKNEEVMLSCPKDFQPLFTHVKCTGKVLSVINGKPVHREAWNGKDSRGSWIKIQPNPGRVQCFEVLQVVPETLKISSTSIKLNWTCMLPDMCQNIRARCRLERRSSPNCEAEEVKGEEILQGQEGTFICSPLQPFTVYSVTISLLPSTILYTRLLSTKEMVPDKLEKLWMDVSTGSLRWKALPSCKGEITGYQLNITTMRAADGSFLEFSQVLVNQSVFEYVPPHQTAGSKYLVTVQGLTAAGAGAASQLEFQTYVQGNGCSALCLAGVASQGVNASLPPPPAPCPCPCPADFGPRREHQLLVAPTHNSSVIEGMCSGQPQLLNASVYVAAVLNLSASTDFVLGDGSRGQGEHNAALRPGCGYTALLRLARRSPQVRPGCCSCSPGMLPAGAAPLLPLGCLSGHPALPCLGRLLSLRNSSKASESNSTIPLRGCRKGEV